MKNTKKVTDSSVSDTDNTSEKKLIDLNKKTITVDLTNTNLAKAKEVQLAIAKGKKEYNNNNPEDKISLSKFEKHLLKVNARWFRKLWRAIKRLLSWK